MIGQWDKSFLKTIQLILMAEWDPIGVKNCPEAADEYDSYAMRVYSYLAAGWSASQIAAYLVNVEYDAMGIGTERLPASDRMPVAEHLIAEWQKFADPKWAG